jgi:hypothetical protein
LIIIPEIKTVLLLVPRAASRSLRVAVEARYPKAMCIYRHMEADGVPFGYERWMKIGVLRHPLDRLWSLYKFLKTFDGDYEPAYIAAQRKSVAMPFGDWVIDNRVVFTNPYDSNGGLRYWPFYSVRHSLPENLKSQWHYLRPDLGTIIYRFTELDALARALGIELPMSHQTETSASPDVGPAALLHLARVFSWDLEFFRGEAR